jgi:hypothetical protein
VIAANGNNISAANAILLGWYGTPGAWSLTDRGNLAAANLYVNGNAGNVAAGAINLTATDSVGTFHLENAATTTFAAGAKVTELDLNSNAQATTTATGNITGNADVTNGNLTTGTPATLNLGAALNLSNSLSVENGGVIAANGNNITAANAILLGYYGTPGAWSLTDRGNLSTANLYVNGDGVSGPINLTATDSVGTFHLENGATTTFATGAKVTELDLSNNAQATTTAVGNITGNADVNNGNLTTGTPATLTLGAALNLSGNLSVENGGVVNGNGYNITANTILVGWGSGGTALPSTVNDAGSLVAINLDMNHTSSMTITGGTISNLISLLGNSTLTVQQLAGQTTGLTFLGTTAGSLTIDPSSMDLVFTDVTGVDWDFRWQDPAAGGNWISTIDGLIASGNIDITSPHDYTVYDLNGYTYIGYNNTAVPEPSSLALCGLGALFVGVRAWRRRKSG